MAFWTNLFSPDTYEIFSRTDRSVTGFARSQISWADRVQVGDKFVCYMTKLSRWVGILEVLSESTIDESPLFQTENDPYVVRFRVKPLVWLTKESAIPIRESRIWNQLSFTRSYDPQSSRWTGKVRTSLNRVSEEDGDILSQEMLAQQQSGVLYPVDDNQYRRLMLQTVRRSDKVVPVSIPTDLDDASEATVESQPIIRESASIQALLARIGETMGYKIWIPKSDHGPVLREWTPGNGSLVSMLPMNYDEVTLKTIEQIDVLWLKGRSIVRAFEVEHTTAIYSGLLRMADLLALQPNMEINLHIVAPEARREKVMSEIQRPVFSLLEYGPLAESCTFLTYDSIRELAKLKHLQHLSHAVVEEYAESPESL